MAEGYATGNINDVNCSSSDSFKSIEYFDNRLSKAKESNDQFGQRQAYVDLGNAYLYADDLNKALYHYKEAMTIGETMNDGVFIAQLCFILGNIHKLKHDYETSIQYHEKHLTLAHKYQDYKGQCQAYLILCQLYDKNHQSEKSKKYRHLYKTLMLEMNENFDKQSNSKSHQLKNLRAESISLSLSESHISNSARSNSVVASTLLSTDEKKSTVNPSKKNKLNFIQYLTKKSPVALRKQASKNDSDELLDIVCRMQDSRLNDQRCDVKVTSIDATSSAQLEDIFNTVDRLQQFRLNDQRTCFPNSSNSNTLKNPHLPPLNEEFFEQIAKCQESRMDDQRANILQLSSEDSKKSATTKRPTSSTSILKKSETIASTPNTNISRTLPDENFFSILNHFEQDEQQHSKLSSAKASPLKKH